MCARYVFTLPVEALARLFAFLERPNLAPRWNIAATQQVPIITMGKDGPHLWQSRWGLHPSFVRTPPSGAPVLNARAETAWEKPWFRSAIRARRCLVPADGYYEWRAEGKLKQPFYISRMDQAPMWFAGLWESWHPPGQPEAAIRSHAFATIHPNGTLAQIHDRMPVILTNEAAKAWLDPTLSVEDARALAQPMADELLQFWPVDRAVGNVRLERPDLNAPTQLV